MERRRALKNIGAGTFSIFAGTALFSSLQSCSRPNLDWKPFFFTVEEAVQMEKICEAIMPKSDTPGATDAAVVSHLDTSIDVMDSPKEKLYFKEGLRVFVDRFYDNMKISFDKAAVNQVAQGINGYLRGMKRNPHLFNTYMNDLKIDGPKDRGFYEIHFVYTVVNATIWSYLTSELIGEQVMAYDPVPGVYDGCAPLVDGQLAWSYL